MIKRVFEITIKNDEDLAKAIKELAWEGNFCLISGDTLIVEFWKPAKKGEECEDSSLCGVRKVPHP